MAPLKYSSAGRMRPDSPPDRDNDAVSALPFDLWYEDAVDDVARISPQLARDVYGVDFGADTDPVPLGSSVPNIWR
jgi:hypothetical protein